MYVDCITLYHIRCGIIVQSSPQKKSVHQSKHHQSSDTSIMIQCNTIFLSRMLFSLCLSCMVIMQWQCPGQNVNTPRLIKKDVVKVGANTTYSEAFRRLCIDFIFGMADALSRQHRHPTRSILFDAFTTARRYQNKNCQPRS